MMYGNYWSDNPAETAWWNNLFAGQQAMQNLGDTIGNAFAFANVLNSRNKQAADAQNVGLQQQQIQANALADQVRQQAQAATQIAQIEAATAQQNNASKNQALQSLVSALSGRFGGGPGQGLLTGFQGVGTDGQVFQQAGLGSPAKAVRAPAPAPPYGMMPQRPQRGY